MCILFLISDLNTIFCGRSVLDEIIRCRFSRAERLLRETDLPLKTIVNLAGFGSFENLRQAFIARTGLAPAAYRTRLCSGTPAPMS